MQTNISTEYKNQKRWRNWNEYIEKLPISKSQSILDIGCGTGDISLMLSKKARKIIAIDKIEELIKFAIDNNSSSNIDFICDDINDLSHFDFEPFDGIWSSFGAAYFTDFATNLQSWVKLLKTGGWIAIIEVNDMFAHEPMSAKSKSLINEYYKRQKHNGTYDFLSGNKLRFHLENNGFKVVHDFRMKDNELVFDGIASSEIIQAWKKRLNRMIALQEFLGEENFTKFKNELINSFNQEQHKCNAEIFFIVAEKK